MEPESREWEVSEEKSYYQGEIENSGWRVGRIHGLESDFVAWCVTKENADRILADHRFATVARKFLAKVAIASGMDEVLDLALEFEEQARSLTRTEGDQAAGEEKRR